MNKKRRDSRPLWLTRVGVVLAGMMLGAAFAVAADPPGSIGGPGAAAAMPVSGAAQVSATQPDNRPVVKSPTISIGAPGQGGDVGDPPSAPEPTAVVTVFASDTLQGLSASDRANALVQFEPTSYFSRSQLEQLHTAESMWNQGSFDDAISAVTVMEEAGLTMAVGIQWKEPKPVSGDWAASDERIGTRQDILETHLDYDAQTGNVFAVLLHGPRGGSSADPEWTVNFSDDGGATWTETFAWQGSLSQDVSAAVAGDYLWVGYVGDVNDAVRMRRFNVADGSTDSAYFYQTVFDKNVPVEEVAVWTNADDFDNRVYVNAILETPAPVATPTPEPSVAEVAGAEAAPALEDPQSELAAADPAVLSAQADPQIDGPDVSAPVIPGSFDGDVRELPHAEPGNGPPMIIPEGQLPDGTGDGWDVQKLKTNQSSKSFELANGALADEVLDMGGIDSAETLIANVDFEGIGFQNLAPPDTVGDVGPNHYIQMVNASVFQIWDKNGNTLAGPTALDSLWTAGGACATGRGDPIVVYDELADRWLMSEFASSGNHLCVYISKTSSPVSGGWWLYDFVTPNFPDYPKYGVWPDAYYVSTYEGALGVYALDRTRMLSGLSASFQRFSLANPSPWCTNTRDTRVLPSHVDGPAPPSGSPNYFFRSVEACQDTSNRTDRLEIYEFDVDWTTPSNSSFTLAQTLTPAGFTLVTCSPGVRDCIPQPGTSVQLDALTNRPLMHLQYRNFGSHQTLVTNQAVDAGSNVSGVRWYELRKTTGSWSIRQQGTYSPDTNGRWMGSIAMNGAGDMALGYSVSSSSVFPSIRYTGRLASDTLGTMPEPEVTLRAGTGSQTWTQRWGDYSAMGVDPADDCTFWYTQQYMPSNGNWATYVGSFAFPTCGGTNLVFFWGDLTGTTWTEQDTGVSNADWGLDASWNEGGSASTGYGFVSYIADAGATDPVNVLRWGGSANWGNIELLSDYTGSTSRTHNGTSVSAYADTVLIAYENSYTNGNGIRYSISYDGGTSWGAGSWDPDVGHAFYNPDLTARGGQGTAIVYDDEAGAFDPVIFRYRDTYAPGPWDAEVAQINEFDAATAWPNRIEYLPPLSGNYAYGAIYISFDPVSGTPYFDRSDVVGGIAFDNMAGWSGGLAVDFDANGLWNRSGSSWTKLTSWDAQALASWSGGLAVDFGANGLWNRSGSSWTKLSNWNADTLAGWSGGLAVDFGTNGLWNRSGSSWTKLTSWDAQALAGWSGGLAVDFGTNGLWNRSGSSWTKLSSWDVGSGGLSSWSGGLAVDFDANGLWSRSGSSWTKLSNWDAGGLSDWSGGLAVDFNANGLWNRSGSSWSKLTGWDPGND